MSWKPRHQAHAIERVRIMFLFKDPLMTKLLSSAIEGVVAKATDFGFDSVLPAKSAVATININVGEVPSQQSPPQNGTLLQRHASGKRIEEVGFRDGAFGYVSSTYGRWENLRSRLSEMLYPALKKAESAAELSSIRMEYWDSFHFEGIPEHADISGLLEDFKSSLPKEVLSGSSQWHSHIGWFEGSDIGPVLINRNLDVADRDNDAGNQVRALSMYSLIEQRSNSSELPLEQIDVILERLHNRSLQLFGESLTKEYRDLIGIDLDKYK